MLMSNRQFATLSDWSICGGVDRARISPDWMELRDLGSSLRCQSSFLRAGRRDAAIDAGPDFLFDDECEAKSGVALPDVDRCKNRTPIV